MEYNDIKNYITKNAQENILASKHVRKDDNIILNILSKFLLPITMIFGFYIHIHGDLTPGGGFQSGVIFACIFCLHNFIFANKKEIKLLKNTGVSNISVLGISIYIITGMHSILFGKNFLNYKSLSDCTTANKIGVFLVELAIALVVFSSFYRMMNTLIKLLYNNNIFKKDE
jgi:multicomponent Na+:H+ antiporter subunit B